jgi:hypothetical protein
MAQADSQLHIGNERGSTRAPLFAVPMVSPVVLSENQLVQHTSLSLSLNLSLFSLPLSLSLSLSLSPPSLSLCLLHLPIWCQMIVEGQPRAASTAPPPKRRGHSPHSPKRSSADVTLFAPHQKSPKTEIVSKTIELLDRKLVPAPHDSSNIMAIQLHILNLMLRMSSAD